MTTPHAEHLLGVRATTLDRALAREVVQDVLARYTWGFSQNNVETLRDCFTLDAEVVFPESVRSGRDQVLQELTRRRRNWPGTWVYTTGTLLTEVGDDEVRARTCTAIVRQRQPEQLDFSLVGWYDDVYRVEGDLWRIVHRTVGVGNGVAADRA